jgi:phosphatidylglycerol:prolipoprotein diacylglycerol transferase
MLRTLFLIPHEVAGIPIFGAGWIAGLLIIAFFARLLWARKSGQTVAQVLSGEGIVWAIVMVAVVFVLPRVELRNIASDGSSEPIGMAIRGYGVMLLTGVVAAVGLAAVRAENRGIDSDVIFSLAPWTFIGGIVGARMFYVIQYSERFIGDTVGETIRNIVSFPEGGLVVYGSLIGGFITSAIYLARQRLPMLKLGDAIVPCIFLGIFFGRIGCLLNGCCYGGRCEDGWAAIEFPPGSPVYQEQVYSGELLGMKIDPITMSVMELDGDSLAERAGIQVGERVEQIVETVPTAELAPKDIPAEEVPRGVKAVVGGKTYRWPASELPSKALPVQAAQVISSGSSLILCLLLCGLSQVFRRDGAIMLLGFAGYAVLRFVLEIVRVDEGGQFGTSLSISQWVSVCVFALSIGGLIWLYSKHGAEPKPADLASE